jgi:esterase/lipase
MKKILIIIWIIYIFINIFLFFNQKNMLYFPNKVDFYNCDNFKENEKKEYKSTKFYEIKWEKNNLIIFFHWNAWRACERTNILNTLRQTWNTIIFPEYFWYADSKKNTPNIKNILKNVEDIWDYVQTKNFKQIYVMWRSLWTWPASYFAWKFKTDKLLLVSAYDKLYKVWANKYPIFPIKYLFTQNYNSINYLKNYKKDFLLIHWKKDKVIPYKHWLDLYKNLENKNKNMISIEKSNHHNIFNTEVKEKIIEYFK